jgi:hypothetical protein
MRCRLVSRAAMPPRIRMVVKRAMAACNAWRKGARHVAGLRRMNRRRRVADRQRHRFARQTIGIRWLTRRVVRVVRIVAGQRRLVGFGAVQPGASRPACRRCRIQNRLDR